MVETHWNKDKEFLVLVGDLFNKGLHTVPTLQYFWKLQKKYPYQVFLVRGNNEQYILDSHQNKSTAKWFLKLKDDLKEYNIPMSKLAEWLGNTPLKWETPHLLVTHAGVSKGAKNPYYVNGVKSVLHNRSPLKNLGKLQVHGHDILKSAKATYAKTSNSWNIDTGAWAGERLTGLKVNRKGKLLDLIEVETNLMDLPKKAIEKS